MAQAKVHGMIGAIEKSGFSHERGVVDDARCIVDGWHALGSDVEVDSVLITTGLRIAKWQAQLLHVYYRTRLAKKNIFLNALNGVGN